MTPPLPVVVAAAALGGLIFGAITPLWTAVMLEHTLPQMLGRVFEALTTLAQAGIPIRGGAGGPRSGRGGLGPNHPGDGRIYLVLTLSMFLNPALHQMDAGRDK